MNKQFSEMGATRDEPRANSEPRGHSERQSPPTQPDMSSLLVEGVRTHSSLLKRMSALVLADARLAASSGLQLAALALAFAIVFVCTLLLTLAATMIFLMWLGLPLGSSVTIVLLLLVITLALLFFAIRKTYEGLRFKASRESIFGASGKHAGTPSHEIPDNQ